MKECEECEYRGYSRHVCMAHSRACRHLPSKQRKGVPASVKIGASALAGAGVGVAAAVLGSTAVSLVGGVALMHALLLKLGAGAGLAGGGVGLYRGIPRKKAGSDPAESPVGDEDSSCL